MPNVELHRVQCLANYLLVTLLPLRIERTNATVIRAIDTKRAACIPVTNAPDRFGVNLLTPKKIEKAIWRGIEVDAIKRAIAKLLTIPVLENVRKSPEVTPKAFGGALAMTELLLDG